MDVVIPVFFLNPPMFARIFDFKHYRNYQSFIQCFNTMTVVQDLTTMAAWILPVSPSSSRAGWILFSPESPELPKKTIGNLKRIVFNLWLYVCSLDYLQTI